MNPDISIITINYNSDSGLEKTVDSVAPFLNLLNAEYILIDGLSTDDSLSRLGYKTKFFDKICSEKDFGIYDAMNKGIKIASGEIIGLLNADDVYLDNTVLEQVAKVFEDQSIDACYADLMYVKQFDSSKIIRYWQSQSYRPGLFEKGWMPAHPTFFVRRKIYEKFGLFDLVCCQKIFCGFRFLHESNLYRMESLVRRGNARYVH
jgi:glycosyltransferase involved in cell wall biosynthesis